ncbi:MAG: hypothetical protein ABEJ76_07285 [Halanaeroarchaeum sp.]
MSDRAVSDVLGYALVFALIVSMVGVVYTTGLGGLRDVRQAEKLENAERAFDVLDANLDDIALGKTNSRGTEIKLEDARLGFGEAVVLDVTVGGVDSYRATMRPIVFESGTRETKIVAIDGAVLRSGRHGSVMLSEPGFLFGERTLVPMLITRARDSGVAGSGRVLVRTVAADRSVRHVDVPAGSDVTINLTTPRTEAWETYFESKTGTDCTVGGDTVTCTITPEDLYVQVVYIDVYLE